MDSGLGIERLVSKRLVEFIAKRKAAQRLHTAMLDQSKHTEILDGLRQFVAAEVVPRHEAHSDLLDNPHRLFTEDGRYCEPALDLMREVRMAAADAGYYLM